MSLGNQPIEKYLSELGSRQPTPGGGAVAGVTGAQAASLISMVAEFSTKTLDEQERSNMLLKAQAASTEFIQLADQDAENFAKLMACYKAKSGIQTALKAAAQPPLDCLTLVGTIAPCLTILKNQGNPNLETDTGIAALLLISTIRASEMNVLVNLRSIDDTSFVVKAKQLILDQLASIESLESIASAVTKKLA